MCHRCWWRYYDRYETLDDLHSYFVDQFDWEKVISEYDRTLDFLQAEVVKIWSVIVNVVHKYNVILLLYLLKTILMNMKFVKNIMLFSNETKWQFW